MKSLKLLLSVQVLGLLNEQNCALGLHGVVGLIGLERMILKTGNTKLKHVAWQRIIIRPDGVMVFSE